MKQYFSDAPIWLTLTPQQLALDWKTIIVVYEQHVVAEGYLRLLPEDSQGIEGRYSAGIYEVDLPTGGGDVHSYDGDPTPFVPPETFGQSVQFLNQEAMDLIRRNDSELTPAELLIDLPANAELFDR